MVESWTRGYQVTTLKEEERWCTPPDRPKWRRAGCSALRNGEEDVEDRPRTSLNGGELVRSTFIVLTFARVFAFVASFILVFVFAFLSPFGSEIFGLFCFATVKKEVSGASAESPL